MAARRPNNIQDALLSKGFRFDNTHHRYLVLHVGGKATAIRTFVSHGGKDYHDDLLSKVQKQLRLPRKQDLLRLIDCPMNEVEYVQVLRDQGHLDP